MSLKNTDLVEVMRDGVSYKATGEQLNNYLGDDVYEVTNSIDFSKGNGTMNWSQNKYSIYTPERGYNLPPARTDSRRTKDVVISFWMKPINNVSDETLFFIDNNDSMDDMKLDCTRRGCLQLNMSNNKLETLELSAGSYNFNEWNHVFIRWSHHSPTPTSQEESFTRFNIVINGITLNYARDIYSCEPRLGISGTEPNTRAAYSTYLVGQVGDDSPSDLVKNTIFGAGKRSKAWFSGKIAEFVFLNLPDHWVNLSTSNFPNMPTVDDFAEFNSSGKWIPKDPRLSTMINFKDADSAKSPVAYYLDFKDANALWKSPATDFQLQNTVAHVNSSGVTVTGVNSTYQSTDTPTST